LKLRQIFALFSSSFSFLFVIVGVVVVFADTHAETVLLAGNVKDLHPPVKHLQHHAVFPDRLGCPRSEIQKAERENILARHFPFLWKMRGK
jgi:hypothetical protein